MNEAILSAQQSLIDSGLINLVVLDEQGTIVSSDGTRVSDWRDGESVIDRLFVLAGMEDIIAAMATADGEMAPLELPAVFLGGNHEDGEPGVSVRLSPLSKGRVLLLLRPLDSSGAMDQISVQQHNDLALLRGQLESAQSQAELNVTARENLFDALRWGFKAPLVTLVQMLEDQEQQDLAAQSLSAIDEWLDLLSLKTQEQEGGAKERQPFALDSLIASLEVATGLKAGVKIPPHDQGDLHLNGSSDILLLGLKALLIACEGEVALTAELENSSLQWIVEGATNGRSLGNDHRLELARSAAVFLGGSLAVKNDCVVVSVPLS